MTLDAVAKAREILKSAFKVTHEYGDRKDWANHVLEPLFANALTLHAEKVREKALEECIKVAEEAQARHLTPHYAESIVKELCSLKSRKLEQ